MMNRRMFLQTTSVLLAGGLMQSACRTSAPTRRVGVQLYTVRDMMAESVPETLRAVAEVGYQEVELAGNFGESPQAMRGYLDDLGLTAPAAHVDLNTWRGSLEGVLDAAHTLGHRYLVCAWLPAEERTTLDHYKHHAELFNRVGEACKTAGIQFAYHNHDFEFMPLDGEIPFDVLLHETDPDLVAIEMDYYWIHKARRNPLDYFSANPARYPLCHVKDMDAAENMTEVGNGQIDFARFFAEQPHTHFFVEHDHPQDPIASIRQSYAHMQTLNF